MRSAMQLVLGAAVVFCLISAATAQQRGGRGGFGGGFGGMGGSRMGLLRNEAVQKELGLTEDQITAIKKIQDENRPAGRGQGRGERRRPGDQGGDKGAPDVRVSGPDRFFVQAQGGRGQLSEEERTKMREVFQARAKKQDEEIAKILKSDQLKRLTEIYIQQAGVFALNNEDVAKELGITDEQKTTLGKVREEQMTSLRDAFTGGGEDREAARAKWTEIRKSNEDKVLAVLTDEQKKKFEEMKGKKFDMPEGARRGSGRDQNTN